MTLAQTVTEIINIINTIVVPFIAALAFFSFIYGVFQYFFWNNEGDEKKLKEGKDFVFWGILGLVVLFSVWGFVNLLLSTLGIAPSA